MPEQMNLLMAIYVQPDSKTLLTFLTIPPALIEQGQREVDRLAIWCARMSPVAIWCARINSGRRLIFEWDRDPEFFQNFDHVWIYTLDTPKHHNRSLSCIFKDVVGRDMRLDQ